VNKQELKLKLAPVQRRLLQEAVANLERALLNVQDALGETDECMVTCMDIEDIITNINSDILGLKDDHC
jgi:hypothetical protein